MDPSEILFDCVKKGDLRLAKVLLRGGTHPNGIVTDATPLHIAAGRGNVALTALILDFGGDPNCMPSEDALTPLQVACAFNQCRNVELLLNAGGDPLIKDSDGYDCLQFAEEAGCDKCLARLRLHVYPEKPKVVTETLDESCHIDHNHTKKTKKARRSTFLSQFQASLESFDSNKQQIDVTSPDHPRIISRTGPTPKLSRSHFEDTVRLHESPGSSNGSFHTAEGTGSSPDTTHEDATSDFIFQPVDYDDNSLSVSSDLQRTQIYCEPSPKCERFDVDLEDDFNSRTNDARCHLGSTFTPNGEKWMDISSRENYTKDSGLSCSGDETVTESNTSFLKYSNKTDSTAFPDTAIVSMQSTVPDHSKNSPGIYKQCSNLDENYSDYSNRNEINRRPQKASVESTVKACHKKTLQSNTAHILVPGLSASAILDNLSIHAPSSLDFSRSSDIQDQLTINSYDTSIVSNVAVRTTKPKTLQKNKYDDTSQAKANGSSRRRNSNRTSEKEAKVDKSKSGGAFGEACSGSVMLSDSFYTEDETESRVSSCEQRSDIFSETILSGGDQQGIYGQWKVHSRNQKESCRHPEDFFSSPVTSSRLATPDVSLVSEIGAGDAGLSDDVRGKLLISTINSRTKIDKKMSRTKHSSSNSPTESSSFALKRYIDELPPTTSNDTLNSSNDNTVLYKPNRPEFSTTSSLTLFDIPESPKTEEALTDDANLRLKEQDTKLYVPKQQIETPNTPEGHRNVRMRNASACSVESAASAASSKASTCSCNSEQRVVEEFSLLEIMLSKDSLDCSIHSCSTNCSTVSQAPPLVTPVIRALSDVSLVRELHTHGDRPGPITPQTRATYETRLARIIADPSLAASGCKQDKDEFCPELRRALDGRLFSDRETAELAEQTVNTSLCRMFLEPSPQRQWREGTSKTSFNYLLLDPQITLNLPARYKNLPERESFETFVRGIFYVGKGKRSRPYQHFKEAIAFMNGKTDKASDKVLTILRIWEAGLGVVSLHIFQNVLATEAYTREACLIDVLGLHRLTNKQPGQVYCNVTSWPIRKRRLAGVLLLQKAYNIYLHEGERQLKAYDIKPGG